MLKDRSKTSPGKSAKTLAALIFKLFMKVLLGEKKCLHLNKYYPRDIKSNTFSQWKQYLGWSQVKSYALKSWILFWNRFPSNFPPAVRYKRCFTQRVPKHVWCLNGHCGRAINLTSPFWKFFNRRDINFEFGTDFEQIWQVVADFLRKQVKTVIVSKAEDLNSVVNLTTLILP